MFLAQLRFLTQLHVSRPLRLPLLLGIAHGLADAAAGFLLGVLPHQISIDQSIWLILLYNGLAFGAQPVFGWLTDRLHCPRLAICLGLIFLNLGLAFIPQAQLLTVAIALAGIGSAAFHVGGGVLAYWATPHQPTGAGVFAAPGIVGLAVGGALGWGGYAIAPVLLVLMSGLVGATVAIARSDVPTLPYTNRRVSSPLLSLPISSSPILSLPTESVSASSIRASSGETADPIDFLWLLIGAIALGSAVWTGLQLWVLGQTALLIGMAIAAAVGKVAGGLLASRWGWHRCTTAALLGATLLLLGGGAYPLTLLVAVALLQSSVPITLTATIRLMPNYPATAAGLALGWAILLGGIPVLAGLRLFPQAIAIAALFLLGMAIALWHSLKPVATATEKLRVSAKADVKTG